jgi:hypothetical protein
MTARDYDKDQGKERHREKGGGNPLDTLIRIKDSTPCVPSESVLEIPVTFQSQDLHKEKKAKLNGQCQ